MTETANLSKLDLVRQLPPAKRRVWFDSLSKKEKVDIMYDINWVGRPDQLLPEGDWNQVLYKPGRMWGKTFCGAHHVNNWAKTPNTRIGIIAGNTKDARDVIVKGDSGILQQSHPNFMPVFTEGRNILEWPNGSQALLYSGEVPEALRGPQFHYVWIDELAKMPYQEEVWDQVQFSLRLGKHPQCIITTTPRPTALINKLIEDPKTVVVNGSSFANTKISEGVKEKLLDKYGSTRIGLQELYGDVLNDNPDALFTLDNIENNRVDETPDLDRVVVAVDPAVTSNADSDLTGIVVSGTTYEKPQQGYVLGDYSMKGTPEQWAKAAIKAYHDNDADCIVAEVNNGGDLVETIIRNIDPNIPYKSVRATRGKVIRAEPVAALYEQGRIHHVGMHPDLETQMLTFSPSLGGKQKSPDRMDALVWSFTELMGGTGTVTIGSQRFGT